VHQPTLTWMREVDSGELDGDDARRRSASRPAASLAIVANRLCPHSDVRSRTGVVFAPAQIDVGDELRMSEREVLVVDELLTELVCTRNDAT
jgi:hypothetical protein